MKSKKGIVRGSHKMRYFFITYLFLIVEERYFSTYLTQISANTFGSSNKEFVAANLRKMGNLSIILILLTLFPYTTLQSKRFVKMILNISQKQTKIQRD